MAVQEAVARDGSPSPVPDRRGFGLSENLGRRSPAIDELDAFTGTIGLPMPNVRIKILDDQGQGCRWPGGEIAIRAAGHADYAAAGETAKVMTPDGYFKSGDIGERTARLHQDRDRRRT